MFTKKSLVLMGVDSDSEKAVLTLEKEGEMLQGRVRLYNFSKEPEGILSLGFYENGRVKKSGLVHSSSMLYTFKTDVDLSDEFSCAVVNFVGTTVKPVLFGSSEGGAAMDEVLGKLSGEIMDEPLGAEEAKKLLDDEQIDYDDEVKAEIEAAIESSMNSEEDFESEKCKNCKYKNCFFGDEPLLQPEEREKKNFLSDIKGQIENLFENNPKESFLEEMIPGSKWVRVEFDGEGDYYILGLIYEDGKIKYVCYGVPGIYQKTPPKQLSGYPVWFPLDSEKRESFGYWLTYQDAESGESIKAVVE